jgi:hypothetical protein
LRLIIGVAAPAPSPLNAVTWALVVRWRGFLGARDDPCTATDGDTLPGHV